MTARGRPQGEPYPPRAGGRRHEEGRHEVPARQAAEANAAPLRGGGASRANRVELGDHAVAKTVDEVVEVARGRGEGAEDVDGARGAGEAGRGIEGGSGMPEPVGDDAVHRALCALEHEAQPGAHERSDEAIAS